MRRLLSPVILFALLAPLTVCAQIQVMGSLTEAKTARPGETYEGVITLQNAGTAVEEAKIYQRDYVFFADGTVIYGEPGAEERSNASWITFSPNIVSVPPGERTEVGYRVKVPSVGLSPGTYWSLLMVEGVPKETADGEEEPEKLTLKLRQVIRYAIQVVTNMEGSARPQVRFANTKLATKDGVRSLQVDVENTGDLWIRPAFSVRLFNMMGTLIAEPTQPAKRIYPKTSVRVVFELPAIEAGTYKALVVADGGGEDLFGANYTLKVGELTPQDQKTNG